MTKEEKIKLVVETYINNPNITIAEVSKRTNIPVSSVQRYLNDPIIVKLFNSEIISKLETQKIKNKVDGNRKGGINSFLNNVPLKEANGKFIGSQKYTGNKDRLQAKNKVVLCLYKLMITNKYNSLEELADAYNKSVTEEEKITRDYVYDCFNASYVQEALGGELYKEIQNWLAHNSMLGKKEGANITNSKRI